MNPLSNIPELFKSVLGKKEKVYYRGTKHSCFALSLKSDDTYFYFDYDFDYLQILRFCEHEKGTCLELTKPEVLKCLSSDFLATPELIINKKIEFPFPKNFDCTWYDNIVLIDTDFKTFKKLYIKWLKT